MITDLSDEAQEYGRQASRAFEAAGGDELVQRGERDPEQRQHLVDAVLAELGAWDLDPAASADELEAAAALCRSAGRHAIPHPIAERLSKPSDLDVDGLVVVDDAAPRAAVGGTDLRWAAVHLDGRRSRATARPMTAPPRKSAFVVELDLEPIDQLGAGDLARALVLPCWTLLGMLDRAIDLTCAYVQERQQFGQALAGFQSVQFQLTDAEVERSGVEQLARYALWSVQAGRPEAVEDALALRLAAIEGAEVVFRITHQLHGAIGFCDETFLSWLSRASQPFRRIPLGRAATTQELSQLLGRHGLSGLYSTALEG
ncbi:acyl-CoA dehydrogenase family protein [Aquihabitans sp. McL0605]|uniref:acyl-CoA dehydrogenase family protein n=1 Tax=Aquihabitans sp. McL0605 TaxID=3415671 RepID=UPI003CF2FE14